VAYPDPKIVTVAAPTNEINPTRPTQLDPHTQRRTIATTSSSSEASTRQSRSLSGPGVGESALVEFASSLVLAQRA
jgi:hypothetical protein